MGTCLPNPQIRDVRSNPRAARDLGGDLLAAVDRHVARSGETAAAAFEAVDALAVTVAAVIGGDEPGKGELRAAFLRALARNLACPFSAVDGDTSPPQPGGCHA
jgi:hypothetical protein